MVASFDDFVLDTAQCSLSRDGCPVRLEKLPLDILILLVERRNELVKREEIAALMWTDSVSVDAEHGINTAIRKIRVALGDSPAEPRYVETVVRRGYRFKGVLKVAPAEHIALPGASAPDGDLRSPRSLPGRRAVIAWIAPIAACALILAASLTLKSRDGAPKLRWTPLTKGLRIHSNLPLASDGKSAFWTEYDENGCRPMRVPLEGGEPLAVHMPFPNAFVLDASPDGHLLLNVRQDCKNMEVAGPLWEFDLHRETATRVGDFEAQAAAYSPDGKHIAVAKAGELWLAARSGSEQRRLASLHNLIYIIRWSPEGDRLRFSAAVPGQDRYTLWEATADGKQTRDLLPDWKDTSVRWGGVWGSGERFIFEATRQGSTDLWSVPGSGGPFGKSAREQITAGPLDFGAPAAIPGRHDLIVAGTRKQGMLERFDARIERFVPFLRGISAEMVDFSRDGQWIAYIAYPDDELWRSKADGSQPMQLTHAPMRAGLPRISPDGSRIAFSGQLPGKGLRVYTVPFEGGAPVPATREENPPDEVAPSWSPEGSRLLFRSDREGGESVMRGNVLEILDLRSHEVTTLAGSKSKFNQRWSSDGKWIVATPNDESELDIFNLADQRWSVLIRMKADYPSVSKDGRFVYFVTNTVEHGASIYKVSVDRGRAEFVAGLGQSERAIDETWGQWSGVTPEGAPLILANADLEQLYLLSLGAK